MLNIFHNRRTNKGTSKEEKGSNKKAGRKN
jgi:hypothetical protein